MNNREIKFKVYSFIDKEWIYFDVYDGVPSGIAGGLSEPCQFTGMFDKNGNPIFEGDIVRVERFNVRPYINNGKLDYKLNELGTEIGEVMWFSVESGFVVSYEHIRHDDKVQSGHRIEVIGNVIENKELV